MLKNHGTLHAFLYGFVLTFFASCFIACSDDDEVTSTDYDPTKSVTITDFVPKEVSAGSKLVIYGENFGNDTSLVKVTIGGKSAVLINVKSGCGDNGEDGIYCFVPSGAYSGIITVSVGDETVGVQTVTASEVAEYQRDMVLSTLAGYKNADDDQGWNDGPFSTCSGFIGEAFLRYDPIYPERLYVTYDGGSPAIQCIHMDTEEIESIMSHSSFGNISRIRTVDFTLEGDYCEAGQYMIVAVDNSDSSTSSPMAYIVKRAEDGTFNDDCSVTQLAAYKQCNGASIHPVNGELYINSYSEGQVWRLDLDDYFETVNSGGSWTSSASNNSAFEQLFTIQDVSWEFRLDIHPTGDYAYIVVINKHYILRTDYNWSEEKFAAPYVIAGQMTTTGADDGVGTSATFCFPYQGTFVYNEEYAEAGREDCYDYYITDRGEQDGTIYTYGHSIRKMTPEGIVRTYAGRGTRSQANDGNYYGSDNGALRTVARFYDPTGLVYNEDEGAFYIVDTYNRLFRTISMEEEEEESTDTTDDSDDDDSDDSDSDSDSDADEE